MGKYLLWLGLGIVLLPTLPLWIAICTAAFPVMFVAALLWYGFCAVTEKNTKGKQHP